MPNRSNATTLRAKDTRISDNIGTSTAARVEQIASDAQPHRLKWKPVFDEFSRSLPVDWICPICDLPLGEFTSCQKCGLTIMHDQAGILDAPQHVARSRNSKNWRKFGRQC